MESSRSRSSDSARESWVRSYAISVLMVSVALAATLLVQRAFPYPFLFLFFAAVMVSAWLGGTGPGMFSVLLSTLLVEYFLVPPLHSFRVNTAAEMYFAAFVICAAVASWVSSSKKRTERDLRETRDQLEIRVSERTEALMKTQAELAHLARVLSMGELTASIAHEISQPLTAVVTHGHASLEWLSANPPNIEKARQTTESIIRDGTQAGAILSRIRALFQKEAPAKSWMDINEVIEELTGFVRNEAIRRRITVHTELASTLPKVKADRVQLQQVVLNLVMNGMDAMAAETGRRKELLIRSLQENSREILVQIEDCGPGLPDNADRIFDPFYTTKPHGIGMGLSISRSIVESHEGRLWASPRPSGGAIFQFTVPIPSRDSDARPGSDS